VVAGGSFHPVERNLPSLIVRSCNVTSAFRPHGGRHTRGCWWHKMTENWSSSGGITAPVRLAARWHHPTAAAVQDHRTVLTCMADPVLTAAVQATRPREALVLPCWEGEAGSPVAVASLPGRRAGREGCIGSPHKRFAAVGTLGSLLLERPGELRYPLPTGTARLESARAVQHCDPPGARPLHDLLERRMSG
jgi:hypothetical protein